MNISNLINVTNVNMRGVEIPESRLEVDVGILLCGQFREMLESEYFYGAKIRWREGGGWIQRRFSLIGAREDVSAIRIRIVQWCDSHSIARGHIPFESL